MSREFDHANVMQFRSTALQAVNAVVGGTTVLDLGGVTFFDSAALGALVQIHARGVAAETAVLLQSVPDRISKLIAMTGLTDFFSYL
jgi:anti-anti-sigma factor